MAAAAASAATCPVRGCRRRCGIGRRRWSDVRSGLPAGGTGGKAGTQSAGGAGGSPGWPDRFGQSGSLGQGGGGRVDTGGGGGGGYYGGGGGGRDCRWAFDDSRQRGVGAAAPTWCHTAAAPPSPATGPSVTISYQAGGVGKSLLLPSSHRAKRNARRAAGRSSASRTRGSASRP